MRHEYHAHPVLARGGKFETEFAGGLDEEIVGHLEQNPRAIPGVRLAPAGPAMVQVQQNLQRVLNNPVRFLSLDMNQKPDAARVMLELRVVKPLFRRCRNFSYFCAPVLFIWLRQVFRHLAISRRSTYFWLKTRRCAINVFRKIGRSLSGKTKIDMEDGG